MKTVTRVSVRQAKAELSKLFKEVEQGREVVIARNGQPVARLVRFPASAAKRFRVDTWRGRIRIAPDFDPPLTEAELAEWGA